MSQTPSQDSTRRSLRQHRRAESAAGAPEGAAAVSGFIELPAAASAPADISAWTGMITQVPSAGSSAQDAAPHQRAGNVPQPQTRREARRLRELGLLPDSTTGSTDVSGAMTPSRARRADAPVTTVDPERVDGTDRDSTDATEAPEHQAEREAIAQEAAALAQLIAEADDTDPTAVDPEIQRRQEALAERAARLNAPAGRPSSGPSDGETEPEPDADHQPVRATHAHGLDSLAAAEAVGRERRTLLIAAAVLAAGLIALVVALILILT